MRELSAVRQRETATPAKLAPVQDLLHRQSEIHDMIERRAYELFENRGYIHGHDLKDWFNAELEVLHPWRHDLKESGGAVIFLAQLPGSFTPDQLSVSVEPRCLTIIGEREHNVISRGDRPAHTEKRTQRIFRMEHLPVDVDPSRTTVKIEGDLLEIVMPKVAAAKKHREKAKAASSQK